MNNEFKNILPEYANIISSSYKYNFRLQGFGDNIADHNWLALLAAILSKKEHTVDQILSIFQLNPEMKENKEILE